MKMSNFQLISCFIVLNLIGLSFCEFRCYDIDENRIFKHHFKQFEFDPDENRDTIQLIESRGYIGKRYFVETKDGYILQLHRIINPNFNNSVQALKPVLLMHGLLESSTDFIINSYGDNANDPPVNISSGRNLGFVLSRSGYDVWLGNSRGNTYCRNHTHLNPNKDKLFWQFTFDEHALIDLPSTIDFILNETNAKTLAYVGHSQGTLIMFSLLSKIPKYNEIIRPFIALAPVAMVSSIKSPFKYLAHNPLLIDFFRWQGGPFLPQNKLIKFMGEKFCEPQYLHMCSNILFLFCGWDSVELNQSRVPVYFTHAPAGTSAFNIIHYSQSVLKKGLHMFDYGSSSENMQRYHQETPPEYELEKITNPYMALMYSQNDYLSDMNDVKELKSRLKVKLIDDYLVPYPKFNHLDFIWSIDVGTTINQRVVKLLDKYA